MYLMLLQNFPCAPELRSGALLGPGSRGLLRSLQANALLLAASLRWGREGLLVCNHPLPARHYGWLLGPGYITPPKSGWRSWSTEVKLWWSWLWPFPLGLRRAAQSHRSGRWARTPAVKSCGRPPETRDGEGRSLVPIAGSAAAAGVFSRQPCSASRRAKRGAPYLRRCPGFAGHGALKRVAGGLQGRLYALGFFG